MTVNYRDCVHGATGGTISSDPALSDSLSQGRALSRVVKCSNSCREELAESGYPQAVGMVTSPSEFWGSFDVIRLWPKERIKARHFGNLLEAAKTES